MGNVIEVVAIKLLLMFFVAYSGGLLVCKRRVRVNYTRKINHFFLFFVPALADHFLLEDKVSKSVMFLNQGLFALATFIIFIKPVRSNVSLITTAFSSFDRPEDRPYTLLWYVSQAVVGYVVLVPIIFLYERSHILYLLDIPILISIFGDGLAEPIGVRFGRHPYATYSIFTSRKYVRTLEGSATIFIIGVIVVCMYREAFSATQFPVALISVPGAITIAEAISPHTWDDPLMIISGSLLVFCIKMYL